jgi:lipopolysaccharide export system permease protein
VFRTLDRYIFREMVPPFFLSMSVLILVLVLQRMFQLADLVVSKGATMLSIARVLIYIIPSFLVITIPMSLLVAALTAFSRMSTDSEITAMKASRISLYSMIRPVFFFAVLACAVTSLTSLILVPSANTALETYLFNLVKSRALVGIEPGVFSSTFDGMVIYVDKMDSLNNMDGVFISDERSVKEPYTIVAKRGKLIADPESLNVTLAMQDGSIQTLPRDEKTYNLMGFTTAKLYLDIKSALARQGSPGRSYEDMGTSELLQNIKQSRSEGKTTFSQYSELHKRLSIPFACLIFGLIGAPLGIRRSRSGKSAGIAIALLVFLFYYIILGGATNLAQTGAYSSLVTFWLPNGIMAVLSVLFVIRKGQDMNLMIGNTISTVYYITKERLRRQFKHRKL